MEMGDSLTNPSFFGNKNPRSQNYNKKKAQDLGKKPSVGYTDPNECSLLL